MAQGTLFKVMWQPRWEESLGENGCMYVSVCVLSHFSHVQLCGTLRDAACQAPLSMGFSRQEYWNGLPCPPAGVLIDPGIEPVSLMSTRIGMWVLYH